MNSKSKNKLRCHTRRQTTQAEEIQKYLERPGAEAREDDESDDPPPSTPPPRGSMIKGSLFLLFRFQYSVSKKPS